jgi:putative peptidoglycan lipid II flippase
VELGIYNYSLNLPNLIFTAVGTSITTIMVPSYSALLARGEKEKAKAFIDGMLTITSTLVLVLLIISYVLVPAALNFTLYKNDPYTYGYAKNALRVLLPVMFFYNINFIFTGYLQSNQKFNLAAAVSIPSSLAMILYMLFLSGKFGVSGLIIATFIGLGLQPLVLLPLVIKTGYRYNFNFDLKNPELVNSFKLIPPVLIGVSAYQINMLYNNNLGTFFRTETLIYLVQNMVLQTILAFVSSISAIYYPKLSVEWGKNNIKGYKEALADAINLLMFILIPAMVGLIALRFNIIDATSKWRNFGEENAYIASNLLGLYSLSVIFIALKEIFDKAFYAQKLTKPSAIAGVIIMAFNIVVSLMLKGGFKTYSLPMAYFASCVAGSLYLFVYLRKKIGAVGGEISVNMLKCFISASIMGIAVYSCVYFLQGLYFMGEAASRVLKLFIPMGLGVLVYFISAYFLKISQARLILNMLFNLLKGDGKR